MTTTANFNTKKLFSGVKKKFPRQKRNFYGKNEISAAKMKFPR
jgi:hypothetical protein